MMSFILWVYGNPGIFAWEFEFVDLGYPGIMHILVQVYAAICNHDSYQNCCQYLVSQKADVHKISDKTLLYLK